MTRPISRRSFLKMGAATIAALSTQGLLSGCGQQTAPSGAPIGADEQVNFSLWYRYFWDPVKTTFEGFGDQFMTKYPNITLEKNLFGDEDYKSTIKVAMASDDPPDLFYGYGGNWL